MSVTGLSSDTSKLYKKTFHQRHESDELGVFEAARYFSGYNEAAASEYNSNNSNVGATYSNPHRPTGELSENLYYKQMNWRSGGRMSLDVPFRNPIPQQAHTMILDKQISKEKKHKQPSSPGGRLASFLNSLFNQTGSKKKKSKSAKDMINVDDESPGGGRRRRRSSISHFRSSSTNTNIITTSSDDSKSLNNFSSSSSGFRTPPPYAPTPTKSYKDFRSFSDHHHHKQVVSLPSKSVNGKFRGDEGALDAKVKSFGDGYPERTIEKCLDKDRINDWVGNKYHQSTCGSEEKECRKFNSNENDEVLDDGAESDSSSDLFELQNYDLGLDIYSSGLPVYETTHMDSIKRGAPINS